MARIRVNPEALSQSAVEISSIARNIQKLGEDLWHISNSAPSYQGQFRSKMRSIGNNALARAKSESAYTNNLSVSLSRKMSAFHSADTARISDFTKITSIPLIGDPMRLALLAAISAFPFALIQRYLILGQLNFGTLWNPTKVYAAETTDFEDSLESENNSIFGFLGIAWGWITGVVGNIFGKKGDILEDGISTEVGDKLTQPEDDGEDSDSISDQPDRSLEEIALRQLDYTDTMGDNGLTIADAGCLITCIAIVSRYYGADVTSQDVNNYIKENGGYVAGSSNLPGWGVAENFINSVTGESVNYEVISNDNVAETIENGEPVIIHVKNYYHDQDQTEDGHWVVAVGIDSNGDYICLDAATGQERIYPKNRLHTGSNNKLFKVN